MSITSLLVRLSLPLGALILVTSCRTGAAPAAEDSTATIRADDLRWQTLASGVQLAVLYGDRRKAEPFGLRLRYPSGYRKEPHYHPNDAYVTVLSGSYHRGYGSSFDESRGIRLVAGTFSVNPAGVAHYEWVEEPAELEVHATGPWGSVYVDANGRAMPPAEQQRCGDACGGTAEAMAPAPAVPAAQRPPTVVQPDDLQWTRRDGGDEVAVLFGNPEEAGPFVLRVRSAPGSREEPHSHPRDAFVTVLSGGFHVSLDGTADRAAAVEVGRLDAFHVRAGLPHFKWNVGSSVVEVRATGPWSSTPFEKQRGRR